MEKHYFICLKSDFDERRECEKKENVGDGTIFGETHWHMCVCVLLANRHIITNWHEKSVGFVLRPRNILWNYGQLHLA